MSPPSRMQLKGVGLGELLRDTAIVFPHFPNPVPSQIDWNTFHVSSLGLLTISEWKRNREKQSALPGEGTGGSQFGASNKLHEAGGKSVASVYLISIQLMQQFLLSLALFVFLPLPRERSHFLQANRSRNTNRTSSKLASILAIVQCATASSLEFRLYRKR